MAKKKNNNIGINNEVPKNYVSTFEEDIKKFSSSNYRIEQQQPRLELKRNNRFLVEWPEKFNIPNYVIQSVNRPQLKIKERKLFGFSCSKLEWENIYLTFIDPIEPSTSLTIYNYLMDNKEETFNCCIVMLDPTGVVIERWNLNKCLIKEVYFGQLDMQDDKSASVTMVVSAKQITLTNK